MTTIPAAGRTIVFAVSGAIHLAGGIATRITGNKLTIAGQTAPGDGILWKDGTLRISGDDIVIRHLRFRHGKYGSGGDCIDLDSGCANAILDHISMSFSTDENISSFGSPPENLTMQWSLNAWGLETHSCGGLWDQNHATCHHSLWAHNHTRNPKARPNGLLEWTNNITFDWDIGFIMGDSYTPAAWKANVINNYFICPPGNIRNTPLEKGWLDRNATRLPNFSIHVNGNLHDKDGDGMLNGTDRGYAIVQGQEFDPLEVVPDYATNPDVPRYYKNATPFTGSTLLNIEAPLVAYKKIVSSAGALRLDYSYAGNLRDEVDTKLFNNVMTQTANHITRESDLGVSGSGFGTFASSPAPIDSDRDGMPDSYENALGWNPAVQDHNTTVSGTTFFPAGYSTSYTRLEEYLHFKASPHMLLVKSTTTNPDIDLTRYTLGFSNAPVFTLANITGGTASQSGAGGKLVHFTAQATAGRGGFDFTVTDAEGSTWTQRFLICVVNTGAPSDLTWMGNGAATANWDTTSNHWLKGAAVTAFSAGDRVTFDATGATSATVNLPGSVTASEMNVNAASSYTFSGAGGLSTTGGLIKQGAGTLTLSNAMANSFSAGVSLEGGSIAANATGALGSATINFRGGHASFSPTSGATITNALNFVVPTTLTINSQHTQAGNWTGANQTVMLAGNPTLWTVAGTWTGFTGRISFGSGGTKMRINGNSNTNFGSTAVAIDLGSNNAQIMNRNGGATIHFGSLESTSTSTVLAGTQTVGSASTYSIGALNTSTTFAGSITDGGNTTTNAATNIVKTGSGTWTLTGSGQHSGTTTVSEGALFVNGSFVVSPIRSAASAVTVGSGATLGGSGSIAGPITASSGSTLAPGPAAGAVGTLTANGGLTLSGTTNLAFDLSNSTAGGNDRITVAAGALTLSSGVMNVTVNLLAGQLANGTYPLIDGNGTMAANPAPTMNLVGLPSGARQTFALQRAANGSTPAFVNLVVSGTAPASLVWTGSGGAAWDLNTTSNFSGGPTATFFNFDTVTFDDTGSAGGVNLTSTLQPKNLLISNSTRAYTFTSGLSGAGGTSGGIGGTGSLTKSGTSTLTFSPLMVSFNLTSTTNSNSATMAAADAAGIGTGMAVVGGGFPVGTYVTAIDTATGIITLSQPSTAGATGSVSFQARNTWSGGTFLDGGSIVLTNEAANRWALGTGAVTFNGGTLTLAGVTGSSGINTGSVPNDFIVPAGQSGTLNVMQRGTVAGDLSGGGVFHVVVKYIRGDFTGNWSAFTGQLNVTAAQAGSEFRMAENYTPDGFPNCAVNLGSSVTLKHTGILSQGAGTTIEIGELSGAAGSALQGGVTAGRALTYRIGGKDTTAARHDPRRREQESPRRLPLRHRQPRPR
ncbi:MAG: autotransporter-associated beta strand repeat-containing protein, partial [Verrucomicrobiales bacterium]|nr:autotransporter-associated beta strand repeat-containing protein [Verrucomicrobiales bacterium]